ncbi:hypothetical protein [Paenibacillus sacheonensis]|uniref:Uncharacterized protein n=1 Tax=Paenibacillus sacheonensis TaxID=742054 RepID=A0A7X5BUV3_9BACL|nr:hypothetical protein [Paenibacillus sacheonensis]MBM7563879.1 hypothetical protein [Paenibacillus sacheonensis]NBC67773.1 hypothetical protein [Paenibacillus sacheonensis]
MLNTVAASPYKLSEDEIRTAIREYYPSGNCEFAALINFALIAHVCYYRADLEQKLLQLALRPTVYLGILDAENIIIWVQRNVTTKKFLRSSTGHDTTKAGRKWIMKSLPTLTSYIKETITEIQNEEFD